eukprot:scaffold2381_cov143-Skeletonema_menzelii.AAC.6
MGSLSKDPGLKTEQQSDVCYMIQFLAKKTKVQQQELISTYSQSYEIQLKESAASTTFSDMVPMVERAGV